MSAIRPTLFLLPLILVALASNATAQGAMQGSAKGSRNSVARNDGRAPLSVAEKLHQQQVFCEEEKQIAEPWIRWGSENRAACLVQSPTLAERDACLESALSRLNELEEEHAATYATQSQHLAPDRPVMRSLLQRLSENTRTAALAIRGDAEPAELRSMRLQNCLASR